MGILEQDTMVRPDQTGLGTASDGSSYTLVFVSGERVDIVSNEAVFSQFSGQYTYALIGSGSATSVNVLVRGTTSELFQFFGVAFRYQDAQNNYIAGFFGQQIFIDSFVSGQRFTLAGSATLPFNVGDFWWIRAVMENSSISVYAWKDGDAEPGTPTVTATDATFANGRYGLASQTFTGTSNSFDHLVVTDNQVAPSATVNALAIVRKGNALATLRKGNAQTSLRKGNALLTLRN